MADGFQANFKWCYHNTEGAVSRSLNLSINHGVCALFGPSGAGKTTIARILCGLERPISGKISLNGHTVFDSAQHMDIHPHKRGIAYLPQAPSLFPHMTVRQNLAFMTSKNHKAQENDVLAQMALSLNIAHLLEKRPHEISGGEARRAALGRAILSNPKLLILDEPFTGLDQKSALLVQKTITSLRKSNIPTLLITHSVERLLSTADQTCLIDDGDILVFGETGNILDSEQASKLIGTPSGGVNLVAVVETNGDDTLARIGNHTLFIPNLTKNVGHHVHIQILSHNVALALKADPGLSIKNQIPVNVSEIRPIGSEMLVTLTVDSSSQHLRSLITRESAETLDIKQGKALVALVKATALDWQ